MGLDKESLQRTPENVEKPMQKVEERDSREGGMNLGNQRVEGGRKECEREEVRTKGIIKCKEGERERERETN